MVQNWQWPVFLRISFVEYWFCEMVINVAWNKKPTNKQNSGYVILQSTRLNEAEGFFVFLAILGYSIVFCLQGFSGPVICLYILYFFL